MGPWNPEWLSAVVPQPRTVHLLQNPKPPTHPSPRHPFAAFNLTSVNPSPFKAIFNIAVARRCAHRRGLLYVVKSAYGAVGPSRRLFLTTDDNPHQLVPFPAPVAFGILSMCLS